MAAYAALVSLKHTIDDIRNHHSPPISLHNQQVESIIQVVGFLQEFLEDYVSPDADGDEADPLEMRIADAAYAAQDVIESHIVHNICKKNSNYKKDETDLYEDVEQVMEEIYLIKKELMKRQKSGMVIRDDQSRRLFSAPHVPTLGSSSSFSSVVGQNSDMVCSEDVLLGIMERLVDGQLDLQIIPILGMCGIDKTTLAQTVYSYSLVEDHFDICAWVTISQQYNVTKILSGILSQVTNERKEKVSELSEDELGEALYKYLYCRRFLIAMDDMWSINAWYQVQRFFPNNKNSSRILVTTWLAQLGSQLNNDYNLQMKFLNEVSSWHLFSNTVFGEESCPSELEKIGKEIVRNCRGLPLSIVVVGGLLKKLKRTKRCWESIRRNLASLVNLDNDKYCLRLLKMSYNHLPIFLKPCFLYMGVFEEDDEIRVSTVVKLWICEGLVKPIQGKSLEASAKEWFKELIDRNLLLSHTLGRTGNIKYCKIHDLLRDLCLNQGKRDGLFHVVGQHCPRGINSQRHLVIPKNTSKKKVRDALQSMSHTRSVISEYNLVPHCQNPGLLKTLHAYKFHTDEFYFDYLMFIQHVNLRYLAIEVHSTSYLFSSMHLFWNLHTLIIYCPRTDISCKANPIPPAQLWRLPRIRHFEFVGMHFSLPDPPSSNVVVLENLQTLKGVVDFKFGDEVVEIIPDIKKLSIEYEGNEGTNYDDHYSVSNIKCLSNLESLHISCEYYLGDIDSFQFNLTFPHSLQTLFIAGNYYFDWKDILEKLGSLLHLQKLILSEGFFRGEWEVVEGQFPSLKYLSISSSRDLRFLVAAEDNSIFPCLEHLCLFYLDDLREITCEIGNIPTLRKIQMIVCNKWAVKNVKRIVEEQMEMQGDQLSFHVEVYIKGQNEEVQSMAGPNFKVHCKGIKSHLY